jgi:hypothetical protein
MSEAPQPGSPDVPALQERLQDVARLLRQSATLDPGSQRALSELVDELGQALSAAAVPPAEVARLAESTTHLAEALHQRHSRGLLGQARDRLDRAVSSAEAHAPVAVGLARRLLDALSDLGI